MIYTYLVFSAVVKKSSESQKKKYLLQELQIPTWWEISKLLYTICTSTIYQNSEQFKLPEIH